LVPRGGEAYRLGQSPDERIVTKDSKNTTRKKKEDMSDLSGRYDFNTGIIEEFRANEGKVGGRFEDHPLILIHHVGAKTGTERVTPVSCFPQPDGRYVILASNGGARTNPDWYFNLKAHPKINVEFGTETFAVAVRELEGNEREKEWADIVGTVPAVSNTQNKTRRMIPVLLLTRITRRPIETGLAASSPPVSKASAEPVTSVAPPRGVRQAVDHRQANEEGGRYE
jgi:deazaflavin-dependent oxidoreductase (nitroreductase family)